MLQPGKGVAVTPWSDILPTTLFVVLSAGFDYQIFVWDIATASAVKQVRALSHALGVA